MEKCIAVTQVNITICPASVLFNVPVIVDACLIEVPDRRYTTNSHICSIPSFKVTNIVHVSRL